MKYFLKLAVIASLAAGALLASRTQGTSFSTQVSAQASPTPAPAPAAQAASARFDQAAAIRKLKEQIKGRETELAPLAFKNIQTLKNTPAGRLLSVMETGFTKSLGVNCTHCHVPDKWEAEDKIQKQTARDMSAMVTTINKELLRNMKSLKSEMPIVNCTTCHRGEIKPALNLPGER
ncbi:MAG TPA: c-type cytochrome [Pyrinomonadaceae bacterium]|nr:c-type cytochrome [Pyrinomonadaceae bacterium]